MNFEGNYYVVSQMIKSKSLNFSSPSKKVVASNSIDEIRELIHTTRSSHWEPPWASWRCRLGLPYGWEEARDEHGHSYFIDHIHRQTTYSDPRQCSAPEGRRTVEVSRKPDIGFGFVAAGQMPTIIQFVSPEGPSEGLLFANDQILEIDDIDVSQNTKDEVVEQVRAAVDTVQLTVEQVPQRTSRSHRRNCKVRFTDRVIVASRSESPSDFPPPIPNVLRVFLENGQTRSFKYNDETTVKDILDSLITKLQFQSGKYFSLAVEYSLGAKTSRTSLLRMETLITRLVALPNSAHLRCVLRFAFIPREVHTVLGEDEKAFEYFYQQCTNDVIRGRFSAEMRYEACIRLAALHMQQVSIDARILKDGRVSLSKMEKDYGLATFFPAILLDNVKRREIRKHVRFYLKKDSSKLQECIGKNKAEDGLPPCTTEDMGLMVRLKYLHIVSHLPSFGGRGFSVTFKESQIEMIMQIDPQSGLLVRHPGKSTQPAISIGFDLIGKLVVKADSEIASLVSIRLSNNPNQGLEFIVERDDVDDLLSYLSGYHLVQFGVELPCELDETPPTPSRPPTIPPPYAAVHTVISSGWNYTSDGNNEEKVFDLADDPPPYSVANSFSEIVNNGKASNGHVNGESGRRGSEAKTLLKATDSLLIKNSKELQLKEAASPLLKRPSNPSGRKLEVVSDSSDTEDSSLCSSVRSPLNSDRLGAVSESSELLSLDFGHRRASIETLMQQSAPEQVTNLESLILRYSDGNVDTPSVTPLEDRATVYSNGKVPNGSITVPRTGHRSSLTYSDITASDDLRLIDQDPSTNLL